MPTRMTTLFLLSILLLWPAGSSAGNDLAGPDETLRNLQEAHNSEMLARARYLAYAEQADAEGFAGAAALFRAAAAAEEIHAANMAQVIRSLGAEAWFHPEPPVVGGTLENLRAAVRDEQYEQETMYPDFLRIARAAGREDAVRSMSFAARVEQGHAVLFAAMARELTRKAEPAISYAVCSGCGHTEEWPAPDNCPSCGTGPTAFREVK